jgi:hypothetical protein
VEGPALAAIALGGRHTRPSVVSESPSGPDELEHAGAAMTERFDHGRDNCGEPGGKGDWRTGSPDLGARLRNRGKILMRSVARLSAGLLAAVALSVGFTPGASAAEPGRTAPTKPLPWEASQLPTGAGEFTSRCVGGCIHYGLPHD